jgi:dolichol-phosphate mannosyltransferase
MISIVVPAYEEEENISQLFKEIREALKQADKWEIVFVDDGSKDRTWERISNLCERYARVKGLRLSRNFGHQYALFAGLHFVHGEAIITMDADLQHPPEIIPKLIEAWRNGAMIVNTIRIDHESISFSKKMTSKVFYTIFSYLSGFRISPGMADFRLFDRKVVEKLLEFSEYHLFLRGLVQWIGYPSQTILYNSNTRFAGQTKYSLSKMARLAWTGVTSFSVIPLRIATLIGIVTSVFAFSGFIYAIYAKYIISDVVAGWTSLLSYISLLFGVLFLLLGILGEYLARILEQVRGRPRFLISDKKGVESGTERDKPVEGVSSRAKIAG